MLRSAPFPTRHSPISAASETRVADGVTPSATISPGCNLPPIVHPNLRPEFGQFVVASDSEFPPIRAVNFVPVRSFTAGGLSKIWGAFATAFDAADLRDYPFDKADLAQSYQAIAARIGISGCNDDLGAFHGDGLPLQSPLWLSPIARDVIERYEKTDHASRFVLGLARNAVLTRTVRERQPCNRCGLCLYGCDRLAIYDATQDLARLRSMPNFRYRAASRVIRVIPENGHNAVEIDMGGRREVARAKALVLAAGTLNTTSLVLSSTGTVGRTLRLLTNPVAALAFVVPSRLGASLPKSGFSLGQLSYRLEMGEIPEFVTGVFYTAETLPTHHIAEQMPVSRRAALRLSKWLSPAVLIATCYLPGRFSQNQLSLELVDGREVLNIAGEVPSQTRRLLRLAAGRLSREMRRCGAYAIPRSFSMPPPGSDGHLAGTLPMVREGPALTCTPNCEVRPWQGIFVVDGACLPSLPAKHCTFTIMANAERVGRFVASQLVVYPPTIS